MSLVYEVNCTKCGNIATLDTASDAALVMEEHRKVTDHNVNMFN